MALSRSSTRSSWAGCNSWNELPGVDAAHLELQRVRRHQAEVHATVAAALRLLDEEVTDPCPAVAAPRALLRSVVRRSARGRDLTVT